MLTKDNKTVKVMLSEDNKGNREEIKMARVTIARAIRPTEGFCLVDLDTKEVFEKKIYKTHEAAERALIKVGFGPYADEILARMDCGESFDSAAQSVICGEYA